MITQLFLDWLSKVMADLIGLIPPLPAEAENAVGMLADGLDYVEGLIAPLGVLIPFDAVSNIVQLWIGVWTFWGAALLVRIGLAVVGR